MATKEEISLEDMKFRKIGNTYVMPVPKKIFEYLKLNINKKYDVIIKEK